MPANQRILIVLDNYATHRHEQVQAWIERRNRIFLHFTPTSASRENLVERFFATLTDRQIRRGVLTSVPHLEKCLQEYLKRHNENPQPLVDEGLRRDHGKGRTRSGRSGGRFLITDPFRPLQ